MIIHPSLCQTSDYQDWFYILQSNMKYWKHPIYVRHFLPAGFYMKTIQNKQSGVEINQHRKKIQDVIRKKLGRPDEEQKNSSKEEKGVVESQKHCDLADLLEVGIPHLNDHAKSNSELLLSTRSERVCDNMEVDKRLKVGEKTQFTSGYQKAC